MEQGAGIRQWPVLRNAGVPALLRDAASILNERPFCQYVAKDDETGAVDVWAAMKLAAGGKFNDLETRLPPSREEPLHAAVDFVESSIGIDLYRWNDQDGRTKEEAIRLLNDLADQLEATI